MIIHDHLGYFRGSWDQNGYKWDPMGLKGIIWDECNNGRKWQRTFAK